MAKDLRGVIIPKPPVRLSGNPQTDSVAILQFLGQFDRQLIVNAGVTRRLDAIGSIPEMTRSISDPPTKADVDAVKDLMNQVIRAAREE